MKEFKTILCPVDFSDFSKLALKYASAIAKIYESRLIVYHAVPDITFGYTNLGIYPVVDVDKVLNRIQEDTQKFANEVITNGIQFKVEVEPGTTVGGILSQVEKQAVDLIVMGSHGRSGFERYLIGSVTNKVLHRSPVPVLVVCKPVRNFIEAEEGRPVSIKRILCPVDFAEGTVRVKDLAFSLAQTFESELLLMHVSAYYTPPEITEPGRGIVEKESVRPLMPEPDLDQLRDLEKLKTLVPAEQNWCTVQHLTATGYPHEEILKTAEQTKTDLIVMGHHTRLPIVEAILGSVTRKVISEAGCPVLVIRS